MKLRSGYSAIGLTPDVGSSCTLAEQLALEREYVIASAGTAKAREGISAFMEKRTPDFLRS